MLNAAHTKCRSGRVDSVVKYLCFNRELQLEREFGTTYLQWSSLALMYYFVRICR